MKGPKTVVFAVFLFYSLLFNWSVIEHCQVYHPQHPPRGARGGYGVQDGKGCQATPFAGGDLGVCWMVYVHVGSHQNLLQVVSKYLDKQRNGFWFLIWVALLTWLGVALVNLVTSNTACIYALRFVMFWFWEPCLYAWICNSALTPPYLFFHCNAVGTATFWPFRAWRIVMRVARTRIISCKSPHEALKMGFRTML